MPDFAYVARDSAGQQVSGKVSAATQREAVVLLDKRALFPVRVAADAPTVLTAARRSRRIKPELMATTYSQLAGLMRSGVPLLRSLAVLRDQTSDAGLKLVLEQVHAQVEDGATLSEAMAAHPRAFGEMCINMVRAGGEGGFLEDALQRVAEFTEQQQDLKGRVSGAMAYPVFLAVVGTLVVSVLVIFFVPKFEDLFARLRERGELPIVTDWLLWVSHTLGRWGLIILAVLAFVVLYARSKLITEAGRVWRDRMKLKLPAAGSIFLNLAVARFCRVLGTLLKNGVPILRSLQISGEATGNRVLAVAVSRAAENISAGESLAAPLAACGHFPRNVVEMIAVAEESNTLDTVLTDIADGLERRTWRRLDLLVRLLEPILLVILAGIVLVIVIALLMPMIKMSQTLG